MNVLMIANQFPPMGGSGVQRTAKFVKYLPLFGYAPVVLTRDTDNLPLRDDTLLADIPPETPVIRTKAHDYTNMRGPFRLPSKVYARKILIPDAERIWADRSFHAALDAIERYDIKLVYSTSYPYSDHLLALKIKRARPDIKWVCDFRDEWTNNPYTLDRPHGKKRTGIEKHMESAVLHNADALISNTPVMVRNFIELNRLDGRNFHMIPNGYDADDFVALLEKTHRNEKFTLVYTGALYGRRKPDTFFEALAGLIARGEIDGSKIHVKLIGNYLMEKLNADIERHGLSGIVEIVPYLPHNECLCALASADCLLLIEGEGRGAEAFYTGKIFEYMMANTPVLAIIPKNGAAAGLVRETNIGTVCGFGDLDEIAGGVKRYYEDWKSEVCAHSPNRTEIAKYERRELTKRLADIFGAVLAN